MQEITHNGKKIRIEFRDYQKGDQNILSVLILQKEGWVVAFDHNLDAEL